MPHSDGHQAGFGCGNDKISAHIAELLAADPKRHGDSRPDHLAGGQRPARHGRAAEADQWAVRAQTIWDAVTAGNQAMLGLPARIQTTGGRRFPRWPATSITRR